MARFDIIAETGETFGDFAPYVASLADAGLVAFQAALVGGGSGVFVGDGTGVRAVDCGACGEVISHPDIDDSGAISVYTERGLVLGGANPRVLAAPTGRFGAIGPLGPTMNDRGVVAFRATDAAGVDGVYTVGPAGVAVVAAAGDDIRRFDGLPVVNDAGSVAYRGETAAGEHVIACDGRTVARAGERFSALGRFPIIDDTGAVAFGVELRGGSQAVFIDRDGELEQLVDSSGPFESFRGVLVASGRLVVFYGTPRGGTMGIFTGPDPVADRVVGIGDALFGSTVRAFVLNPVSVNRAGQIAIRFELNDGRGVIARAEVS